MDWRNVPGQYPKAAYEVDATWRHLENWLKFMGEGEAGLDLSPDYQRSHVWTEPQQISFVEYALRGGEGAKVLYWNCSGWNTSKMGALELVDGKQRMEAVQKFMRGALPAFGHYLENARQMTLNYTFRMRICALETRADVLRWYLAINAGGTPHSEEELDRVRLLLKAEEG